MKMALPTALWRGDIRDGTSRCHNPNVGLPFDHFLVASSKSFPRLCTAVPCMLTSKREINVLHMSV